jgi:ankyrin repeat protein
VATGEMNLTGIRYLIEQGVDADAANTFGETFLHLVKWVDPDISEEYSSLLRLLSGLSFPFRQRDVHGRTFLHVLFESSPIQFFQDKTLCEILSIVKPNHLDMDNQGHTLQKLLDMELGTRSFVSALDAHKSLDLKMNLLCNSKTVDGRSWKDIWINHDEWVIADWLNYDKSSNGLEWIDSAGDNILSSLLKLESWDNGREEPDLLEKLKSLLNLGVPIHMRDKEGNTALAIATVRGLRSPLSMLLSSGANCNTRNYKGTGILSQASLRMLEASRENDDRRYATILSCFTLLVESGAKAEPTQQEEWIDRSHREM